MEGEWVERPDLMGPARDRGWGFGLFERCHVSGAWTVPGEEPELVLGKVLEHYNRGRDTRFLTTALVRIGSGFPNVGVYRAAKLGLLRGKADTDVLTGDEAFDDRFRVGGDAAFVHHVFDADVRVWMNDRFDEWTSNVLIGDAHLLLFAERTTRARADRIVEACRDFRQLIAPRLSTWPGPGATAAARPQWAADPHGRHELRYWDGVAWTQHVSDAGVASLDPA